MPVLGDPADREVVLIEQYGHRLAFARDFCGHAGLLKRLERVDRALRREPGFESRTEHRRVLLSVLATREVRVARERLEPRQLREGMPFLVLLDDEADTAVVRESQWG